MAISEQMLMAMLALHLPTAHDGARTFGPEVLAQPNGVVVLAAESNTIGKLKVSSDVAPPAPRRHSDEGHWDAGRSLKTQSIYSHKHNGSEKGGKKGGLY
jgi:hypothetical protein